MGSANSTAGRIADLRHLTCFCFLLLSLSAARSPRLAAEGQEWPGWRGADLEGRSPTTQVPAAWSPSKNIAWKTAIPGDGYSSPIVCRDSVYVTTALPIRENALLGPLSRFGQLGGMLLLVALAVRVVVQRCRSPDTDSSGWRTLAGMTVLLSGTLMVCALIFFAEEFLDFKRDPERGWWAASLVGSLSLSLCGLYPAQGSRARLVAGALLLAFAAVIGLSVPDRQRAYGSGHFGYLAVFTDCVIALPAVLGALLLGVFLSEGREGNAAQDHSSRTPGLPLGSVLKWLAIAIAILALAAMTVVVAVVQRRTLNTVSIDETYGPAIRWWALLIAATVFASSVLLRSVWGSRFPSNLAVVIAATSLCLMSVAALLEQVVAHFRYLSYLLGEGRLQPMLGWWAVKALAAVFLLSFIVFSITERRLRGRERQSLPMSFRVTALYLTTLYFLSANYLPKGSQLARAIVSVDRTSGSIKWICRGLSGLRGQIHSDNSPATPTPVTDGRRVYAYFGTPGLLCSDDSGNVVWRNRQLPFQSREGVASSPVLCDDKVIVLGESDAGHYLAAVDCRTGRPVWKTSRNKPVHSYAGNCRTPVVKVVDGRKVIVVWGLRDISGYDPVTGRELWSHDVGDFGSGVNPVASQVSDEKRVYLVGPEKTMALEISKLHLRDSPIAWSQEIYDGPQCASPVLSKGLLFSVSDNGTAYCLDARNGHTLWRVHFWRQHYASPVAIGNRIYFCDTHGVTTVVACDSKYRKIALNDLREPTHASFAPVEKQLFIRAKRHLYCVSER